MARVYLLSSCLFALLACARAFAASSQELEPDVVASEGEIATLRCLIHGNPEPNVQWMFRAHTPDDHAGRYTLRSDGALVIEPVYRSDAGVYICLVDNVLGVDMHDVSLVVNGPKSPTNQSCSPDGCPAEWVVGPWEECSQRCGSGGVKTRDVSCKKVTANGIEYTVPDKSCIDQLGPKPEVSQKCNEGTPCLTWLVGKRKTVQQRRIRHRREGGQYLPATYVIPEGEGGGPWGEWGEVSPCSRTCGGGVASQKRICLQPGSGGQSLCTGGDTKYFSCQTQDCPDGSGDFRAEQCAEFNDKDFRGLKYNWLPYTKAANPCELNCMPHGDRFYLRHKLQVTDGTRCNDESFDVCVNGRCQPVGCDMMLNSTAREDKCRECRGTGANCHTTEGIFDSRDLMKGHNDILLIPEGSTNINISEIEPSNNYLALRAKNGTNYLNGHYHIDFSRTIMIAGSLWTYEGSQLGFAAADKLRCRGPTTMPLYLSLLLQDKMVGIRYEYSVPNNSARPTDKRYNWVHEEFTPCSATCGGGFQSRKVTCRSREELEVVEDRLCDESLKPPTNQSCSLDPCPAQWVEGPWGECSQRCGSGGVRSREVNCQKIIANDIKFAVPDKECFDQFGPKPEVYQKCNEDMWCPAWLVGQWRPCDKLCGEGNQTRRVLCYQKKNGRIEMLDDEDCTEEKPESQKPCMLHPCDGGVWFTSEWYGCDSSSSKIRTRRVICLTDNDEINERYCPTFNRPIEIGSCYKHALSDCEVQWYGSEWSKCSVNCGDGVQTRDVFCGKKSREGVEKVEDIECANLTEYLATKPCTVPMEECHSQWMTGPWTECSKTCGGGEQYRHVRCVRGDSTSMHCDVYNTPDSVQLCNALPCVPDELVTLESPKFNSDYEASGSSEILTTHGNSTTESNPAVTQTTTEDTPTTESFAESQV